MLRRGSRDLYPYIYTMQYPPRTARKSKVEASNVIQCSQGGIDLRAIGRRIYVVATIPTISDSCYQHLHND
jgi:hypothetical protein